MDTKTTTAQPEPTAPTTTVEEPVTTTTTTPATVETPEATPTGPMAKLAAEALTPPAAAVTTTGQEQARHGLD